jgi:hypothetical protein
MKIHNVFIEALGKENPVLLSFSPFFRQLSWKYAGRYGYQYCQAKLHSEKKRRGTTNPSQTGKIAEMLERYKSRSLRPCVDDYQCLRDMKDDTIEKVTRHDSDYYLIDKEANDHYLIELKIGGDLDNKKARSEKEAILEQYAILSNTLPRDVNITIHLCDCL